MTEPKRPADAPSGPTPEEISARLESLLKRTHALRADRAANPSPPLTITWPPSDRELEHYDVVGVPEDERMQPSAPAVAVTPAATAAEAAAGGGTTGTSAPAGAFARPDWSELRLRSAQDDPPRTSRRLLLLTILLGVATLAQAAYIWSMPHGPARGEGRLRVDGPDGAAVRVNGEPIGAAPVDHALAPGDYDIEITQGGRTARVPRLSIGLGRTVVVLPAAGAGAEGTSPASIATSTRQTTAPDARRTAPPAAPAAGPASPNPAATAPAAVSATLGGVLIESTPSGLPVTMEGRERGVTPITIGQLKPGRHDVLVGGLARKVDVVAGSVTSLRVTRQ